MQARRLGPRAPNFAAPAWSGNTALGHQDGCFPRLQPPCIAPTPALLLLQKYIDLVAEGDLSWESHEALKDYREEEA